LKAHTFFFTALSFALSSSLPLIGALLLLCASSAHPALASKPRLRIERVDSGSCAKQGIVTVYAVEIELEGILRRRRSSQYRLTSADGKPLALKPEHARSFSASELPLHVCFVVQVSTAYQQAMPTIKDSLIRIVRAGPRHSTFSLIAYHSKVEVLVASGDKDKVTRAVERLAAAAPSADSLLVTALRRGLGEKTKKAKPIRRIMVVVSDGVDSYPDWDRFRKVGSLALEKGVAIYTLAFSPKDERGPLLNLGEISKRSRGYLRWAKTASRIAPELLNLEREISAMQLLTYRLPNRCQKEQKIKLVRGALESRVFVLPKIGSAKTIVAETKDDKAKEQERQTSGLWLVIGIGAALMMLSAVTLLLLKSRPDRDNRPAVALPAPSSLEKDETSESTSSLPTTRRSKPSRADDDESDDDEGPADLEEALAARRRRGATRADALEQARQPEPEREPQESISILPTPPSASSASTAPNAPTASATTAVLAAPARVQLVGVGFPFQLAIPQEGIRIGSDPRLCAVALPSEWQLAPAHADFIFAGPEQGYEQTVLVVRDLNSSLGTYVNGQQIGHCALRVGDVVQLGPVLRVQVQLSAMT
jgi:hypothetical protein